MWIHVRRTFKLFRLFLVSFLNHSWVMIMKMISLGSSEDVRRIIHIDDQPVSPRELIRHQKSTDGLLVHEWDICINVYECELIPCILPFSFRAKPSKGPNIEIPTQRISTISLSIYFFDPFLLFHIFFTLTMPGMPVPLTWFLYKLMPFSNGHKVTFSLWHCLSFTRHDLHFRFAYVPSCFFVS